MRNHYTFSKKLASLSLIVFFAACASSPPVPQDNFYHLATIKAPETHQHQLTIALKDFQSEGLYRERALLYINAQHPLQTRRYHYHFWIKSPTKLIRQHMTEYLLDSQFAKQIHDKRVIDDSDLLISGQLQRLDRIIDKETSKVIVRLRFDVTSRNAKINIFSKTYTVENEVKGKSIHDTVESYSTALIEIYEQFIADMPETEKAIN